MPFFGSGGAIHGESVVPVPSTTQTATGSGTGFSMETAATLRLTLNITAVSGTTPSMTVNVQTSEDGSTWTAVASFAAATAVSTQRKVFTGLDRYARVTWTISGTTPSFTFSVSGEAV
jgi:hypothetical protein